MKKRAADGARAQRLRPALTLIVLAALLAVSAVFATGTGAVHVPFTETVRVIVSRLPGVHLEVPPQYEAIIWSVRLPRVLTAGLVGLALGICGAAMQGLFRNPMASPDIVGVSSGAAMGAVAAIFLGWSARNPWLLPAAAFAGAWVATVIAYALATQRGHTDTATLLLAGVAVSSFFSAVISLLYHFVDNGILRQAVYWMMGNLNGKRWEHVGLLCPFVLAGSLALWAYARDLNVLLTGEDQARSMGVNVERTKRWLIMWVALVTGAAVAVSGSIGFVGLIVPHILRRLVGPDHRWLMPASALGGASLLILSDLVARTAFAPVEVRPGIVTSLLGVPFFLYLLVKARSEVQGS